jgi:prepilin-type N-terminal cleavage/methylation domain-containing protein
MNRRGMTAIELLVSMTLTALLMVFVLTVLGTFTRRQNYFESRTDQSWRQPLRTQLRSDLLNSRRLIWRPNELTLVGFAGRDFKTGRALHRAAEITYTIERFSGESWLMRHERHINSASKANSMKEAVVAGVDHFSMEAATDRPLEPDVAIPIPAKVRVTFSRRDKVELPFDEYFFPRCEAR